MPSLGEIVEILIENAKRENRVWKKQLCSVSISEYVISVWQVRTGLRHVPAPELELNCSAHIMQWLVRHVKTWTRAVAHHLYFLFHFFRHILVSLSHKLRDTLGGETSCKVKAKTAKIWMHSISVQGRIPIQDQFAPQSGWMTVLRLVLDAVNSVC